MTTTLDPMNPGPRRSRANTPYADDREFVPAVDESAMESAPAPDRAEERKGGHLPHHDLPVLEAYRGIASLLVVLTHVGYVSGAGVSGPWAGWLSRLDFGVALFFLLSGFLLFRPYVQASYATRPAVRTGTYLRRRYVRLYPALLLALAANWFITPAAREQDLEAWLYTTFLVQNYDVYYAGQLPGMAQLWSLSTEVAFYLALPILALIILGRGTSLAAVTPEPEAETRRSVRRQDRRWFPEDLRPYRPVIVLAVMVVITWTWRIWSVQTDEYGTKLLWLPAFLDWFAAGMAMAWLRERPQRVPAWLRALADSPGVCLTLAVAVFWLVTTPLGGPYGLEAANATENITKHIAYLIAGSLLMIPAAFGSPTAGWREWATAPVMRWLGQISFGVFLWHPMLMEAIRRGLGESYFTGGFWITLVLTLIASLVVGTLSWRYLEKPFQQRFRDGLRRRAPQPGAAPRAAMPRLRLRRSGAN